ncbi:MAG: response regulator [Ignavibacteriales bacterium]|nr:response regulator [Ignavibacteriales bacterium]
MTTNYFNSSITKDKLDSLLIIEKDEIQRKGLIVAMMDSFTEIRLTNNPHEAIAIAKKRKFSVIISEAGFDVISGSELIKNLYACNPDSLIIVISSYLNEEIKTELQNAGAQLVFDKPIDIQTLLKEIFIFKNKIK